LIRIVPKDQTTFGNQSPSLKPPLSKGGNGGGIASLLTPHSSLFKEVSWDEAYDFIAKRLNEIKERYGPDSIGGLSSARCTTEENYLFQKFMRAVIGTNNVDHCARY
jgi:predicted molibdopterin-dependent oxidoreductase YjgC